jgi:hypothetical protein
LPDGQIFSQITQNRPKNIHQNKIVNCLNLAKVAGKRPENIFENI